MKVSLRSFLRRNWLAIIAILIGIAVSNHFYQKSIAKREPVFLVDPSRTEIIDCTRLEETPLRVVRASGDEIKGDVTSTRFYFWNNGRQSIKPSNILEPLIITLDDPDGEILDYKILKQSREVVKPLLQPDTADPGRSLFLSFGILEPEDGLTSQVIYKGNPDATLTISGTVEGVRVITTGSEMIKRRFWFQLGKYIFIIIIFLVLFGAFGLFVGFLEEKEEKKHSPTTKFTLSLINVAVVLIASLFFYCLLIGFTVHKARRTAATTVIQTVPADIIP